MAKPVRSTTTTLAEMTDWLDQFAKERDWERFHTPKNLSMSIAIEAAEIMELVQWTKGEDPIENTSNDSPIAEEIADVLSYLLRLASVLGIDPAEALALKIKKNAIKYPVPTLPQE